MSIVNALDSVTQVANRLQPGLAADELCQVVWQLCCGRQERASHKGCDLTID